MAKIVQTFTRPSVEYDFTVSESQARDIDGIINKLNTTYQQDLKDEVEACTFSISLSSITRG